MSSQLLKAILNLESCAMRWAHEQSEPGDYADLIAARLELLTLVASQDQKPAEDKSNEFKADTYIHRDQSSWNRPPQAGVRVTHSSGIFEQCHSQRSQWANKEIAFTNLKIRLKETQNE